MPRRPILAVLLGTVLALAGCSGGGDPAPSAGPSSSAADGAFPVTVTGDTGELTLEAEPERIVSMSASATETLFAIDAGDQVVAVDSTSTYPAEAPVTDLSAFTPNAEAIAGYEPDLVVISDDVDGLAANLDTLGIPVLQLGAAEQLDDAYAQMTTLGDATGHRAEADDLVQTTQDRIDAAVAAAGGAGEGLSVYHELDPTGYTATSSTFVGGLYTLFGLTNVADAAGQDTGYPQLSAEYVVDAAPDVVVLADTVCCAQDAATLAARPAFDTLPAVQTGRVLAADDDIASRWGPRIADLAEQVSQTLQG
ncbi:ABC transporter substrate-binding protein [Klenkia taihuensis]|uniref:Iron complex transport system substrate-binding protein n=1 Tax=Klenkia taihuensis TaxID=1225127 RepID=A0A1I1MB32_9ACTN|nr:ABC transporter substrate-binding protein [Klenkia taihuensis]GHE14151.1 ABC transporter substrate-binding protein [Klenkia taihuensis]SFC82052.1 iron complex transport system substrate-binding protein [Klenkia taihuensis]